MKNLKGLTFKAKRWDDSTKEVKGELSLIDYKTLEVFDPEINRNGYLMVIVNGDGKNLVQPDTVELVNELTEVLQSCEGCEGKWEFDKMNSDSEGVPLCDNCYDALIQEEATWKCKKCDRTSTDFVPDEHWAEDNLCSTCAESDF